MGSYNYIFFFPGKDEHLDFDPMAYFSYGTDIVITEEWKSTDIVEKIRKKINNKESFQISYGSPNFFFFAGISQNVQFPFAYLMVHCRSFERAKETIRERFMDKIGMLGNAINASYIVSVIEAPFSFGEKFFYIDEALFIENVYLNGRPCRIEWMWLRKNVVFPILTCEQQMLLKRTNDAGYNEFE